jgi:hypothetical protein
VEERPPDKGRSTNKCRSGKAWSTDEGRSTGEAGPASKAAAEPGAAHAAEAANVRCTEATAAEAATPTVTATETATPTVAAAATPSKGRGRNQRGADHGRHGDRDQFFVNHRDPPFVEASPLCVIYQLLSKLNTDIPVTRITIADHDCPPRGRGSRLPACPAAHSEIADPDFRSGSKCEKLRSSRTTPLASLIADIQAQAIGDHVTVF